MKTLIIFYSYTGHTKAIAEKLAGETQADVIELKDQKPRSTLGAYVIGSLSARRQKQAKLQAFTCDFSLYDTITIAMPIWAGFPAPAFNTIVEALPSGKNVELIMISGSGNSKGSAEKTKALIAAKGCRVVSYQDIKA